jgi:hypothetical protein
MVAQEKKGCKKKHFPAVFPVTCVFLGMMYNKDKLAYRKRFAVKNGTGGNEIWHLTRSKKRIFPRWYASDSETIRPMRLWPSDL